MTESRQQENHLPSSQIALWRFFFDLDHSQLIEDFAITRRIQSRNGQLFRNWLRPKSRSKICYPGDDHRWFTVVFVIADCGRNQPSKKKDGDHTQPPKVFGDRHGCRRRTDDMGDRDERDREPSAHRLGLKLTESALVVPGRSARAASWWGIMRQTEREENRVGGREKERKRKRCGRARREGEAGLGPYYRDPLQSAHRVPRASTIISLRQFCLTRGNTWDKGTGEGLEGFIIFTRRYRSNPTILIPRREAIVHFKERPTTDPRSVTFIRYRRAYGALILSTRAFSRLQDFLFCSPFALMLAECDRIAARFPPRELRGDRGLSVAAVASVVPLLEKYILRWVGVLHKFD